VRIIIEAVGRQLVIGWGRLEPEPERAPPSGSTTASQVELGNDGVHQPFGFAPVIKARHG
jgi:hypothetical protein